MRMGFTLLELSIVLVIIGLIIGGITVGQELIKQSELKRIVSDVNKYKTAVNAFKLKYNAVPGDMDNATDYWGIAAGTGSDAACRAATVTDATCNGNGDGRAPCNGTNNQCHEMFRVAQHLALAEIIPGAFTGSSAATDFNDWWLTTSLSGFLAYRTLSATYSVGELSKNGIHVRKQDGSGQLSVPEAYSIDIKNDDGQPDTGKILATNLNSGSVATGCVDGVRSTSDGSLEYELNSTARDCILRFIE